MDKSKLMKNAKGFYEGQELYLVDLSDIVLLTGKFGKPKTGKHTFENRFQIVLNDKTKSGAPRAPILFNSYVKLMLNPKDVTTQNWHHHLNFPTNYQGKHFLIYDNIEDAKKALREVAIPLRINHLTADAEILQENYMNKVNEINKWKQKLDACNAEAEKDV